MADPVPGSAAEPSHQVRLSLSGGINPASPRVLRPTLPLGRTVSQVMLPLCKPIRNQASGGNWRALGEKGTKETCLNNWGRIFKKRFSVKQLSDGPNVLQPIMYL